VWVSWFIQLSGHGTSYVISALQGHQEFLMLISPSQLGYNGCKMKIKSFRNSFGHFSNEDNIIMEHAISFMYDALRI